MESKKDRAIFRADGGAKIGLGHIMRSLSLAEGLSQRGIQCIFITRDIDPGVGKSIVDNNHLVERLPSQVDLKKDLTLTINLIKKHQPRLVITDSYAIDEHYLEQLKRLNITLMSIDDLAKLHFCSDVVLNQNVGIRESDYSIENYTKLLIGPKYALLRKNIRDNYHHKGIKRIAQNILVTLGGTDSHNQTLKVIRAIKAVKGHLRITVVMGPGYLSEEILREETKADTRFIIIRNPGDIFSLMAKADLAISAGGSTCYELAYLGVPNIILVLADNQRKSADCLDKYGASINLGWFEDVTEESIKKAVEDLVYSGERREEMRKKGKELVDDRGVERVLEKIWR